MCGGVLLNSATQPDLYAWTAGHKDVLVTVMLSLVVQASGKGISIVEISERCQDPKATGPNIRPSSPRTVEAFLRSGVDPEDLVYKPLSYFKDKTGDTELAKIAFDFFEESRIHRLDELRQTRQALIDDGWKPGDVFTAAGAHSSSKTEGTEDLVERERKRLEVLRNR